MGFMRRRRTRREFQISLWRYSGVFALEDIAGEVDIVEWRLPSPAFPKASIGKKRYVMM